MRSPRKTFHTRLPDSGPSTTGSTASHLALLVVMVNVVACLIAARFMVVVEQDREAVARAPAAIIERSGPPPDERTSPVLAPFRTPQR